MTRFPDWLTRLSAYIEASRRRPYDYAQNNCGMFAAGAIQALTGEDPLAACGIVASTLRDWTEAVHARGGLRAIAIEYAGEMVPPLQLRRGDLAIRQGDGGETLGVCMGDHLLFLSADGLQVRALTDCDGGWRIG